MSAGVEISERVERRARWVLGTLGGGHLRLGEDVPFRQEAWDQVERGELPQGDAVAEAFFHLARIEEIGAPRDRHGRFFASSSCLDPLDPPLERLRRELGVPSPRYGSARFVVALTHDVDVPWRWTRIGMLGAAARVKGHALAGRAGPALHEARGLARVPLHRLRGSDPNWRFAEIVAEEREHEASSTFFVMAGHGHRADGAAPEAYERLRPRLVETLVEAGAEVGLHGSYLAAEDLDRLATERALLAQLDGPIIGHRYHYLRIDPHRNLVPLQRIGFHYDTSLGFPDAVGFRAGIAHPFRPWDLENDRPADLVEVPLAVMDATLAEERYEGLSAAAAKPRILALLDRAAENGGGFSILWHPERFDPAGARGWDRLYFDVVDAVRERGGVCMSARDLAATAADWLGIPVA
ncbi:MAG TPA: polysaccharide deacetylase family protein [Gaiellaceae bacterium]|nr:polysaccharide deacetylase family protein [Gaiellaceae bacterium]